MHPVSQLIFGVAHAWFPVPVPDARGAIPGRGRHRFSDHAIVDLLDRLDVVGLTAVLGAGHDGSAVLDREIVRSLAGMPAFRVQTDWFLGEDVLAGLHGTLDVPWPEPR